jgi:hypothetical protein
MADYDVRFNRLALSASDLKRVTAQQKPGEPWPDALIEDYLNILRDLVELAQLIDDNAGEIIRSIDEIKQSDAGQDSRISKLYGKISALIKKTDSEKQDFYQFPGKLKGMIDYLGKLSNSIYPIKSCLLKLVGNGVSNPIILTSYNVLSATRSGVGAYLITFEQSTFNGIDLAVNSVYSNDFKIAGNATSDLFGVEVSVGVGSFTINTYQYIIVGPKITKTAYDLALLDSVNVCALLSGGSLKALA